MDLRDKLVLLIDARAPAHDIFRECLDLIDSGIAITGACRDINEEQSKEIEQLEAENEKLTLLLADARDMLDVVRCSTPVGLHDLMDAIEKALREGADRP